MCRPVAVGCRQTVCRQMTGDPSYVRIRAGSSTQRTGRKRNNRASVDKSTSSAVQRNRATHSRDAPPLPRPPAEVSLLTQSMCIRKSRANISAILAITPRVTGGSKRQWIHQFGWPMSWLHFSYTRTQTRSVA